MNTGAHPLRQHQPCDQQGRNDCQRPP